MIVGVLSDTHGRVAIAREAVRVLADRGAEYFVHCGDVCGEGVLDALAGLPSAFVFGNNDYDRAALSRYADAIGVRCLAEAGSLDLGGRVVAVTHGDDTRQVARFTAAAVGVDYLLTGHSHRAHDRRVGRVRWLNPGVLFRATTKTVLRLDLASDAAEWIEIAGP